jgi:DNA-directed RNA polymerase specialized sigma24 family protein
VTETEKFELCERVIRRVVWAFCKRNYDLDFPEVLQEAQLLALDSIRRFNGNGDLESWVGWCVRRGLAKLVTTNPKWRRRMQRPKTLNPPERASRQGFDLHLLLWHVSEDSRYVIKQALRDEHTTLQGLFGTLRALGWPVRKICKTFAEIREALV